MAPQLYDEILLHGATFADLDRGNGPIILASATDISSGARFVFNQTIFDDGGISDNLGMRGVLDALQLLESLHDIGVPTPIDHARRIIVFVVNSLSSPSTNWDESERPPGPRRAQHRCHRPA